MCVILSVLQLIRFKTYSRLLEAEMCRMQRVTPGFGQSPQFFAPGTQQFLPGCQLNPMGGFFFQQGPPLTPQGSRWLLPVGQSTVDQSVLMEEPPSTVNGEEGAGSNGNQQQSTYLQAPPTGPSLPSPLPLGKRVYGPSSSPYGNLRQSSGGRMHRYYHHRGYHMRQKQQPQYLNQSLTPRQSRPSVPSPALPPTDQTPQAPSGSDSEPQSTAALYEVL